MQIHEKMARAIAEADDASFDYDPRHYLKLGKVALIAYLEAIDEEESSQPENPYRELSDLEKELIDVTRRAFAPKIVERTVKSEFFNPEFCWNWNRADGESAVGRGRKPRLSEDQIKAIQEMPWYRGMGLRIAKAYGVSPGTISNIRRNTTFKLKTE